MDVAVRVTRTACLSFVLWLGTAPTAFAQLPLFGPTGPRSPVYSTEARDHAPVWLELPRTARVSTGDGLRLTPVHNSAISSENLRLGVLVGAFRNDGDCTTSVNARMQYVDDKWQPMGAAIPNEARVSRVAPGELLPFRFRLRKTTDAKVPPAAYVIVIEEDAAPMANPFQWNGWVSSSADTAEPTPCEPQETRMEATVTRRQPLREGFLLSGTTTVVEGGPVRADGVVITAVLRNKAQQVLEVLVGTPTIRRKDTPDGTLAKGQDVPFKLQTNIPVGLDVAHVDVMVELLPDAHVADAPEALQRR